MPNQDAAGERLYAPGSDAADARWTDPIIWVPGTPSYTLAYRWYGGWHPTAMVRPTPSPQPAQWQPQQVLMSAPAAAAQMGIPPTPTTQTLPGMQQQGRYGPLRSPTATEGFGQGAQAEPTFLGLVPAAQTLLGLLTGG